MNSPPILEPIFYWLDGEVHWYDLAFDPWPLGLQGAVGIQSGLRAPELRRLLESLWAREALVVCTAPGVGL